VSALWAVVTAILLVLTAIGIYGLQAWLEQWEYRRHQDD
jgi:hypothetical protein